MAEKIYFTSARSFLDPNKVAREEISIFQKKISLIEKFKRIIEESKIFEDIMPHENVVIKMHFGEIGTTRTIRSVFIRTLVEMLKKKTNYICITESSGLGLSTEGTYGIGRIQIAQYNGYTSESCGAPIIPNDGLKGLNYITVKPSKFHTLNQVHLGKLCTEADKIIVLSHFKGHIETGFGGALKNIGVGCAAKPSKYGIHFEKWNEPPVIDLDKCTKCNKCIEICPAEAIENFQILKEKCKLCWGCGDTCEVKAVKIIWITPLETQKRVCDVIRGFFDIVGKEKIRYINFMMDLTPSCDCVPHSDVPVHPDVGIFIGRDIIAIDKACLDVLETLPLIEKPYSEGITFEQYWEKTGNPILKEFIKAAKNLDLGSEKYELIKLEPN
ncbi:MAG: DUF362 domain-containing protein [Candidatus Lokiarchaeota archaeon]|nr:DUF362 domain-containing protein [Candidatus Lokiarchaeota archaeon]